MAIKYVNQAISDEQWERYKATGKTWADIVEYGIQRAEKEKEKENE